jgi:hypothetical protein
MIKCSLRSLHLASENAENHPSAQPANREGQSSLKVNRAVLLRRNYR